MARRLNGEGTIYQRSDGLYIYEMSVPQLDGSTKRKRITARDPDKLQKKINEFKHNVGQGIITNSYDMTLNEWIETWLNLYVEGKVKSTTYDNYDYAYQTYIKNSIGKNKIEKITPSLIQMFVNSLNEKGLSLSTIKKPIIVMNQALKKAVLNNIIHINPCHDIDYPKNPPKKIVAMTKEEQQSFESSCPDTTYGRMFLFALNTGMRNGEILALTWDDVDMDNKIIHIKNTAVRINNREENAEVKVITEIHSAKTDSGIRDIPMNTKVYNLLLKQKESAEIFCFESTNGKILDKRNIIKALKKVISKAGNIKTNVTMHVLRHSFATRLLEKNANIKAVSEILGHRSIQITLDTYSHVLPKLKSETINLLD